MKLLNKSLNRNLSTENMQAILLPLCIKLQLFYFFNYLLSSCALCKFFESSYFFVLYGGKSLEPLIVEYIYIFVLKNVTALLFPVWQNISNNQKKFECLNVSFSSVFIVSILMQCSNHNLIVHVPYLVI